MIATNPNTASTLYKASNTYTDDTTYYAPGYLGYASSASVELLAARKPCFFVHDWRQRGRHLACSDCGEIQQRGVDVSSRRRR